MLGKRKKPFLMMNVFVAFVFLACATAGFAARIIPIGTVSIIEDGKVIGEFSREIPLPEGALLRCKGNCAVKLDDAYMAVEPRTVFSVSPVANRHELLVQQGTVYYSLKESSRPLHFVTPAGDVTTGHILTDGELIRGYVRVFGNEAEISVMGGGSMMLKTGSGEITVDSGKKVVLTLVDSGDTAPAGSGQESQSTHTEYTIADIEVGEHPDHGGSGGEDPGDGDPGGGDPGDGDPGDGDPGDGDPGGGDPADGDPAGGDPADGKGGGKGGDTGGDGKGGG